MSKTSKILIGTKFFFLNGLIISLYLAYAVAYTENIPAGHTNQSNKISVEKSNFFQNFHYTENFFNTFTGPLSPLKNYLKDSIEKEIAQISFLRNKTHILVIFTNSVFNQLKSKDIIFPFHWFW